MSAKQIVLDKLKSGFFSVDIYSRFIETLMFVNLRLLGLTEVSISKYRNLINLYLYGAFQDPDEIIEILKK